MIYPISPPYMGPKEIKYLFIDGACLDRYLERIFNTYTVEEELALDYGAFTHEYTKVFYYNALPGRKNKEPDEAYFARRDKKREFLDRLSRLGRFHVNEGEVRRDDPKRGNEQKTVDVMIAVHMMTHSFRRNMHQATLLSGDLDFKPLIDALVLEGMSVTLWYPEGSTAKELIAAADRSIPLTGCGKRRVAGNIIS
jgi:uncharacterized LabA/DUF88 family protein